MIPKKPALDVIRGGTGFRSRSCSNEQQPRAWSDSIELDHGL